MGDKPVTDEPRDATHSTVIVAQQANPRLHGARDVLLAVPDSELLAETELEYGPVVPDALPDGTIPADKMTGPLLVTAAKWDATEEQDLIWLWVDGNIVGDPAGIPLEGEPDPVPLEIPYDDLINLSDGVHRLHFTMGSGFGDTYVSQRVEIIIDKTPPGGQELPLINFNPVYEQEGVALDDIVNDGDILHGTIATYSDQKNRDTITTYLQTQATGPNPAGPIIPGPVVPVPDDTSSHTVDFTLQQLLDAQASGSVDFWYEVRDYSGNVKESGKKTLRMLVFDAPVQLEPPVVPLFSDDDLITEEDGRTPISVGIPQFGHAKVGDIIYLVLATLPPIQVNPPLNSGDLPADPDNPDPTIIIRTIDVRYETLVQIGSPNEVFSFPIMYQVGRGAFRVDSPALPVDVDLSLPPGPDPDPTTPEWDALHPPSLLHSGPGAVPNEIPANYLSPVKATIRNLTNEAIPRQVFEAGDVVQLYRLDADGTTWVAMGPQTTVLTPNTDLEVIVPNNDIVPGVWTIFYRVGRNLATGQVNWALSPRAQLTVGDLNDVPGGGNPLPFVNFRESEQRNGFPALGYTRASNGTILRVYEYLNWREGDVIELTWQGNNRLIGTGTDIPGTLLELTAELTEEDMHEKDDRLFDDEDRPPQPVMRRFKDFVISYDEIRKIKPSPTSTAEAYGSAWVTYKVTAASGGSNESVTDRTDATFLPLVIDARPPTA